MRGYNPRMTHRKHPPMSEQIRQAIDASDKTRYRVALEAGIDHATMSRFMAGKVGMSLETLDRLIDVLDLELVPRRQKGR